MTMESASNGMNVENISRVFAPTLFPETPLDAANPMLAFADVQLQKVVLTHLITKYIHNEGSILANMKMSSKMMSRIQRSDVGGDDDDDDDEEEEVEEGKEEDCEEKRKTSEIEEVEEVEKVEGNVYTKRASNIKLSSKMMNRLNRYDSEEDEKELEVNDESDPVADK